MNTCCVEEKNHLKGHYFIFQLKDTDAARELWFMDKEWHNRHGKEISVANYDLIYGGPLFSDTELEDIFVKFNLEHPKEFKGHSLSVSDVIVMVSGMEEKCFFVDSFGYAEIPSFLAAWAERDIELAFQVGDRYLCLQTSSEGGFDYDILKSMTVIIDGGNYDDDSSSALIVANELIMSELKTERPEYGTPGFDAISCILKGSVVSVDDVLPCDYTDFEERENYSFSELCRDMVLEQYRMKTAACYDGKPVLYELAPVISDEDMIEYVFGRNTYDMSGLSAEELETEARVYAEELLQDTGLTVKEVVLVGGRSRGMYRHNSDCDFLVEYEGDMKEDSVFNILNEDEKKLYGVRFDFNPFREEESGSLAEHLLKAENYLSQKKNTYFRIYWKKKGVPDDEAVFGYVRAYDESDAMKVAEVCLNLNNSEVTGIVPAKRHQITRQSLVLNCMDVIHELETNY